MKKADIVIKGSKEGLTFFLDSECEFSSLVTAIEEKLGSADNFLIGANVSIDVGSRELTEEQLGQLKALFPSFGLIVRAINTWSEAKSVDDQEEVATVKGNRERIYQIANHLYEANESSGKKKEDGNKNIVSPTDGELVEVQERSYIPDSKESKNEVEESAMIDKQGGDEQTLLIQRTLRSGQRVRYPGHVVIMGEVNPGAEVIAGGNIIVLGSFRGVAHAGAFGSTEAIVMAFRLQPTQLRIADHITRPPDEGDAGPEHPEIARIRDGMVTIERYQYGSKSFGKD
ncbi:septum site-determining protein MinC [Heliorestis acidaminivorans]|uniref:Probable septum site-determining protein MinC n=1 Tax=Heliorestis acidaminivorans TaxID=553427 RepID=A0A6I0F260_9FIRM|nr:septum site-determining protein MinC [Heliorestis acidaminivorans]KAB2952336.1 septum site-determining protein MinC [Heliorestis acidaminivorans]